MVRTIIRTSFSTKTHLIQPNHIPLRRARHTWLPQPTDSAPLRYIRRLTQTPYLQSRMTPITAFDVSIDLNLRGLKAIKTLLEKASSQVPPKNVPEPATDQINDIPSLAFHVQACTNLAAGGVSLLTRTEQDAPAWTVDGTTTLDDLISHVAVTIVKIENSGVRPADLEGVECRTLSVKYGNGQTASWGGREYILGYNIPNFMFHLCGVYSSLNSQGVEVGKMDYLMPFMEGMAP